MPQFTKIRFTTTSIQHRMISDNKNRWYPELITKCWIYHLHIWHIWSGTIQHNTNTLYLTPHRSSQHYNAEEITWCEIFRIIIWNVKAMLWQRGALIVLSIWHINRYWLSRYVCQIWNRLNCICHIFLGFELSRNFNFDMLNYFLSVCLQSGDKYPISIYISRVANTTKFPLMESYDFSWLYHSVLTLYALMSKRL